MALRIGLVGLGFMGKVHYNNYANIDGADVVAVCDIEEHKRKGDWSGIVANIGASGERTDLSGKRVYADATELYADDDVDVVDITLPTFLHADNAVKALEAGKHVICEKPIAITSAEAARMVDAAKSSGKKLFVAHCIRFWPAYAEAAKIIRSGAHGKVLSAVFRRIAATPLASWENWLQTEERSGLCPLDLHIHDSDFILYAFGAPKSVTSRGAGFEAGRLDHIISCFDYGDGALIAAEGSWIHADGYGFEMSFNVSMEKATLACGPDLKMRLCERDGGTKEIEVPPGDGYGLELAHFVDCIANDKDSDVVTPETAKQSVKLVELEIEAAKGGKTVDISL